MSLSAESIKVVRITQQAAAAAKDYFVSLGWRPVLVWAINLKAAGSMAIAVDAFSDAGTGVSFGKNAAMAAVADGITIEDNGVKIGQNANLFKDNDAEIVLLCIRNLHEVGNLNVADATSRTDAFEAGEQYGEDAGDLSEFGISEAS